MKIGCSNCFFLNTTNLICRSTDISNCFWGSLRFRDNEESTVVMFLCPFLYLSFPTSANIAPKVWVNFALFCLYNLKWVMKMSDETFIGDYRRFIPINRKQLPLSWCCCYPEVVLTDLKFVILLLAFICFCLKFLNISFWLWLVIYW